MTFFNKKEAEYQQFRKDLFDRIAAETSWTAIEDYSDTEDSNGDTGYAVYDPGSDATDLIWVGTKCNNQGDKTHRTLDLRTVGKRVGLDSNNLPSNKWSMQDIFLKSGHNNPDKTDTIRYWMSVTDNGFGIAAERVEADSNDAAAVTYVEKVNRAWDYTQASEVDSTFSTGRFTSETGVDTGDIRNGSNSTAGKGIRNPDEHFDNYPRSSRLLYSHNYRNSNGKPTLIGTTGRVLRDLSKSDIATGDTVQDASGKNVYMLFSFEKTWNCAMKMV
jgi:hypothetical protein